MGGLTLLMTIDKGKKRNYLQRDLEVVHSCPEEENREAYHWKEMLVDQGASLEEILLLVLLVGKADGLWRRFSSASTIG